jgi:chromosomal replication initiation ATPase DnaA
LEFEKLNNNEIVLNVKNLFAKQVLTNDFLKPITNAINNATNGNFDIFFKVKEESYTPTIKPTHLVELTTNTNINRNYTFNNFIVNEFNKSAYAAAQSIFKQAY